VYSASGAQWYVLLSSAGYAQTIVIPLGGVSWATASEDYDGDGKVDLAVFNAAGGAWNFLLSGRLMLRQASMGSGPPARRRCRPIMTGTKGRSGLLSRGGWHMELPAFGRRLHGGTGQQLRGRGLRSGSADYDSDGKVDPAVYRESDGAWHIMQSGSGYVLASLYGFGAAGAGAIPARL